MEKLSPSIQEVVDLLKREEVFTASSPLYNELSRTWAAQKNLKPHLVVQPRDLNSLSRLIALLGKSDLGFAVRCAGMGSASARDVLISMAAFDGFEFDRQSETITIGAGQTWAEVDNKMERLAPGYAAISTRCTFVGVAGSVLAGGIGWLSSEYGLASDPHNMLDAQIVTINGEIKWASEEPDILWALRGGGGGFAATVVTTFKLRVYKYTSSIYSGRITYPKEALPVVAKAIADFVRRSTDPRTAMHFYCLDLDQGAFTGQEPRPGIAIFVYDANGEEHGRSNAEFKWALDIEGAVDETRSMTYKNVNASFDDVKAAMGLTNNWMSGITVDVMDEKIILNAWNWFDELLKADPKLSAGTFVLIEVMQPATFHSITSSSDCAWPHTTNRHVLQLGTGAIPGSPSSDALAKKALADAPWQIKPTHSAADYIPNQVENFNDTSQMFGANFKKMQQLKMKIDPRGRLKSNYIPRTQAM